MSKIGLDGKPSNQLATRSSVVDTDRVPIFTATGTEPQMVSLTVLNAGGILDSDNTFSGTNTFSGIIQSTGSFNAGASGIAGSFDIFPGTASKGKFTIAVTDQTGNTTVTWQIGAHGQATSVHLGDVGLSAAYLLQSTAQITAVEADILDGATSSTAEFNILTGATLTTAELNRLDDSAEVESVTAAGAASVTKFITNLNVTSGGAVTLAACPATMIGKIKTIRMTSDDGDVTIALTNVQGGTAGTTATFDDISEELILIGSAGGKWTVIKEFGVTLS